jgi:hypothetical protein
MCESCELYNTEVEISSPGQLDRIIEKVQAAVESGALLYSSYESDRENIGQPSFMSLKPAEVLPDIMRYHFACPKCGESFRLSVETYHGAGGRWWCSGGTPSNHSLQARRP